MDERLCLLEEGFRSLNISKRDNLKKLVESFEFKSKLPPVEIEDKVIDFTFRINDVINVAKTVEADIQINRLDDNELMDFKRPWSMVPFVTFRMVPKDVYSSSVSDKEMGIYNFVLEAVSVGLLIFDILDRSRYCKITKKLSTIKEYDYYAREKESCVKNVHLSKLVQLKSREFEFKVVLDSEDLKMITINKMIDMSLNAIGKTVSREYSLLLGKYRGVKNSGLCESITLFKTLLINPIELPSGPRPTIEVEGKVINVTHDRAYVTPAMIFSSGYDWLHGSRIEIPLTSILSSYDREKGLYSTDVEYSDLKLKISIRPSDLAEVTSVFQNESKGIPVDRVYIDIDVERGSKFETIPLENMARVTTSNIYVNSRLDDDQQVSLIEKCIIGDCVILSEEKMLPDGNDVCEYFGVRNKKTVTHRCLRYNIVKGRSEIKGYDRYNIEFDFEMPTDPLAMSMACKKVVGVYAVSPNDGCKDIRLKNKLQSVIRFIIQMKENEEERNGLQQ